MPFDPGMVDLDRTGDWVPSLTSAQSEYVPKSVQLQMATASPRLIEDALDKLFDLAPRDAVIRATLQWIGSRVIAAYHGSRLTNVEVASVRTNGLVPLKADARRVRLQRALSCHPRWAEASSKLGSALSACAQGREGRVTLAFSRSALIDDYNHYLTHGSEFDQCVAEKLFGQEGIDLLAKDGKKTLFQVAICGDLALRAANPYRSIDEILARGEIPQLVKEFLRVWSYCLAHPDCQANLRRLSCDMALESGVPAAWITMIAPLDD